MAQPNHPRNDVWTILYSAPEEGPKDWTGDLVGPGFDERRLLPRGLARARRVAGDDARVLVAVLEQEEPWWRPCLAGAPRVRIVQQPLDRGSGIGLLVALLYVYRQAPDAPVVIFCSDHVDEDVEPALEDAVSRLRHDDRVILFGRPVSYPLHEHSVWIVPDEAGGPRVSSLVFDPTKKARTFLAEQGAMLSAPTVVGSARALLALFERAHPYVVEQFMTRLSGDAWFDVAALDELYPFINMVDFFHDVVARSPRMLAVSDLPSVLVRPEAPTVARQTRAG